jgi:hypothetical protein
VKVDALVYGNAPLAACHRLYGAAGTKMDTQRHRSNKKVKTEKYR